MPLRVGARLGPYEIVGLLGAGGMGEVYRARDAKLARDVAIKVLPASFASDPDRLDRFQREARLLASLNHPNIAAIYGFEDTAGLTALVLELVEGETLAARIVNGKGQGPGGTGLPIAEALAIARQIVDALDAAHERGIVHRDLKPANIHISHDGVVKVLDFGVAKAAGASGDELTNSPTVIAPTRDGVLLGTAPYMSPEQARGKPVDKRTDIWAFGCVLYEMLTGRAAFSGETTSDVIAAILEREPDWRALPASTPANVRRLLERCVHKDPRRRLRDIGDVTVVVDATEPTIPAAAAPRTASRALLWLFAGALLASAGFAAWQFATAAAVPSVARDIQFQRLTDSVGVEESPAMSPDGKTIAFVAHDHGKRHVWVRLLAGGASLRLTGDDVDAWSPRWAPDSSSLIYQVPAPTSGEAGTLWEIAALGGPARQITTSAQGGGDISHDGGRVAVFQVHDDRAELVVVGRDGTTPTRIATLVPDAVNASPRWSPDDRWIAFQVISGEFESHIRIVPAAGGEPRIIARGVDARGLSWLPDGSGVVYSSSKGSTVSYPPTFSLRVAMLDGAPERQLTFGDVSYVDPDVHASGALLASRVQSQSDIWRIPTDGSPADNTSAATRITRNTGVAQTPSLSPDGSEIVYLSDNGGHGNLWVAKTDGSSVRQITLERDPARSVGVPVWSPVSKQIAFIFTRGGTAEQWLVNSDGSGLRQLTTGLWAYWSPDGRWLYITHSREGRYCIDKVPVDGGESVQVRCDAIAPALSPDGSTLYFVTPLVRGGRGWDFEVRKARPESAPSMILTKLAGSNIPGDPFYVHTMVSPDGRRLALPLTDGTTTNLFALSTDGGALQPLTNFQRAVTIARRISWAHDGQSIYAAVADVDADIILLNGLMR